MFGVISKIVIAVMCVMFTTMSYAKTTVVKCNAELTNQKTKDGFALIKITCDDDVLINKHEQLTMYVNKSVMLFSQLVED